MGADRAAGWMEGAGGGAVKCTAVLYTHAGLRVWSGLISPAHQATEEPRSLPRPNLNQPELKESDK